MEQTGLDVLENALNSSGISPIGGIFIVILAVVIFFAFVCYGISMLRLFFKI